MPGIADLFGPLLLIGASVLAVRANRYLRRYRQVQHWPKVSATVVRSVVRETSDSDGTSYRPEFAFRYSVAGQEYVSTQHTDGLPFMNREEAVRRMVCRYPVGAQVDIAVCPADPADAVVDTGFPEAWSVLRRISMVAIAAGTVMTIFAFLHHR